MAKLSITKQEYIALENGTASADLIKRYLADCAAKGIVPAQL